MERDLIRKIIEDGKETDCVDFKQEFYKSFKESDLPKDISAFANVNSDKDKYIVFGIDDKTRQVVGIEKSSLPTQDQLDDYLSSVIEPFVHTEIGYFEYSNGFYIGYIKVIANNKDFLYMIKKDCGINNKIKQGDIYIRKGATIQKATRADVIQIVMNSGTVLLRLRDSLICIEPINGIDLLVEKSTYGRFDMEILNSSSNTILIDTGIVTITSDKHAVQRNIVSILPSVSIRDNPLSLQTGSRKSYKCLFEFYSQDCVDFGFASDGLMDNAVIVQVSLYDTDNNEYQCEAAKVMLKAKGG